MAEPDPERPVRTLKPWGQMTPIEQAHHLVHDHGFGVEEYWRDDVAALKALDDDAAVVEAWVNEHVTDATAGGNSYPHPPGRSDQHEGDHNGDGTEAGGNLFDSGIGSRESKIDLHVHRTPQQQIQERFPLTAAVAVNHKGDGETYTDGWVTGYVDNGLLVASDVDQSTVTVNVGVDVVTLVAGPVVSRWEAVSRVMVPSDQVLTTEGQIEWLLHAVTVEHADPSQRTDDLRSLGKLLVQQYPTHDAAGGAA